MVCGAVGAGTGADDVKTLQQDVKARSHFRVSPFPLFPSFSFSLCTHSFLGPVRCCGFRVNLLPSPLPVRTRVAARPFSAPPRRHLTFSLCPLLLSLRAAHHARRVGDGQGVRSLPRQVYHLLCLDLVSHLAVAVLSLKSSMRRPHSSLHVAVCIRAALLWFL